LAFLGPAPPTPYFFEMAYIPFLPFWCRPSPPFIRPFIPLSPLEAPPNPTFFQPTVCTIPGKTPSWPVCSQTWVFPTGGPLVCCALVLPKAPPPTVVISCASTALHSDFFRLRSQCRIFLMLVGQRWLALFARPDFFFLFTPLPAYNLPPSYPPHHRRAKKFSLGLLCLPFFLDLLAGYLAVDWFDFSGSSPFFFPQNVLTQCHHPPFPSTCPLHVL